MIARGFKSFCPCQKRETSVCLSLFFRSDWGRSLGTRSVSGIAAEAPPVADAARRGWRSGRRLARRPRRRRQSRAPQEGLRSKFKSVPPFSPCYGGVPPFFKSILGFLTRLHPSPTAAPLSSTQNAPGFAFFGLFRVRFSLFRCFLAAKFSCRFLCILPHSVHRLNPSVNPCRREVSFLT